MTLLYFDELFTKHDTGKHPENADRIVAIGRQLATQDLFERCLRPAWEPATTTDQRRAHTADYIDRLSNFSAAGGGVIEQDTILSRQSFDVSRAAAGAACDAVKRVIEGEDQNAFCAIRPPGHHALTGAAMGFCLLNNVAIAALHALEVEQLNRVLIVDWDVHHGNGTQAIFWDDPRVGFLSLHRWPFYPGTGAVSETGSGDGLGTTVNVPIAYGTPIASLHAQFAQALTDLAARIEPELILVSAGFDAHRQDPIGSLDLEVADFVKLTETVQAIADQYSGGRLVSLLEGGYHPQALADSVAAHVQSLLTASACSESPSS